MVNDNKINRTDGKNKGGNSLMGCFFIILTLGSIIGFGLYFSDYENYKVGFSISVLWLSHSILHILTFRGLRTKNPYDFRFAKWEMKGKLYYYLGVKIFRKIILYSPFALLSLGIRILYGRGDLDRVLREIYVAEKSHIYSSFFASIIAMTFFFMDLKTESLYLLCGIIIFHLYPIMLQRWNRDRLIKLINEMNKNVC